MIGFWQKKLLDLQEIKKTLNNMIYVRSEERRVGKECRYFHWTGRTTDSCFQSRIPICQPDFSG